MVEGFPLLSKATVMKPVTGRVSSSQSVPKPPGLAHNWRFIEEVALSIGTRTCDASACLPPVRATSATSGLTQRRRFLPVKHRLNLDGKEQSLQLMTGTFLQNRMESNQP